MAPTQAPPVTSGYRSAHVSTCFVLGDAYRGDLSRHEERPAIIPHLREYLALPLLIWMLTLLEYQAPSSGQKVLPEVG